MGDIDMESVARELIENLGGLSNIIQVEDCITRIRVSVKSLDKVNMKNIKILEEVFHIFVADTVQIVVGPGKSRKIAKIIRDFENLNSQENDCLEKKDEILYQSEIIACQKKGIFKSFLEKILNR